MSISPYLQSQDLFASAIGPWIRSRPQLRKPVYSFRARTRVEFKDIDLLSYHRFNPIRQYRKATLRFGDV